MQEWDRTCGDRPPLIAWPGDTQCTVACVKVDE